MKPSYTVRTLARVTPLQVLQLAEVLVDCVEGGASVSFMQPLSLERAQAFWSRVAEGVAEGTRALVVAQEDDRDGSGGRIVGTVQAVWDLPENQPHRADVAKLLVHRQARRHGLGERLMQAVEAAALAAGKTVLVLDTASDEAMRLYERQQWQRVGRVPNYAHLPQGGLCDTVFYCKQLSA